MTTTIDGLNIYYREEGPKDGPLLVLLHGWGANTDLFDGIYKLCAKRYHVIGPDFPGAGKSAEPAEPMDLDDYVSFVKKFLSAVAPSAERVVFLGHSHGGRVLIHMAAGMERDKEKGAEAPFVIDKMILVDSAGIVAERTEAQKKKTARYKRWKAFLTKSGLLKLMPGLLDALQKRYGSADYAQSSPVMRQTMVRVVNADLKEEMPSVRMPVLLIWGENDTDTPLANGREMECLMPEAGLAVIPGVGHFSFLENPGHFLRILCSFLGLS